jgi:hypothetical protein
MGLNEGTEEHNSLIFLTMADPQPYYGKELITAAKSFTVPASEM